MSLLQIVLRSLRQHLLSTLITSCSIALASGLLMSVWVVKDQARRNFTAVDSGFDGVFGARGSKLQLVLNSIFLLHRYTIYLGVISPASSFRKVLTNAHILLPNSPVPTLG